MVSNQLLFIKPEDRGNLHNAGFADCAGKFGIIAHVLIKRFIAVQEPEKVAGVSFSLHLSEKDRDDAVRGGIGQIGITPEKVFRMGGIPVMAV